MLLVIGIGLFCFVAHCWMQTDKVKIQSEVAQIDVQINELQQKMAAKTQIAEAE